jgi:glucose/arabinose dehydrogenase
MKYLKIFGALAFLLSVQFLFAQRGLPPREKTRSTLVTKYAQHLDFLPPMVKLLNVPAGWEVSIAAYGLGRPRMLYSAPNGKLYITRRDGGDVLMLTDADGDNKFEDLVTVAADFRGVHGITAKDNWMYLCNNTQLRRYKILDDGKLSVEWETLINDLPSGGQHPNRTIDFGPDGFLYITVGTLCNDCKENDPEVASILQVDPKTWKRKPFATGLRNTIGFDWHPVTNELWGFDNGSDGKGNRWPPEELNRITQEGMYGYPFAYGKNEVDQSREDPAGDTKEEWTKNALPSSLDLPAHMAPIGFQFFGAAANIPPDFSDDGVVCWHGSWNRSKPVGFKVQRVIFQNGLPTGTEDFLTGFLKPGFLMFKRKARFGRPAGVSITSEGVVYISDDVNGVIYAVKRSSNVK